MFTLLSLVLVPGINPPQDPQATSPANCFIQANALPISTSDAVSLCFGIQSTAPVQCFLYAISSTTLDRKDALWLCQCSTTNEPVDCFQQSISSTTLDKTSALRLCFNSGKYTFESQFCLSRTAEK